MLAYNNEGFLGRPLYAGLEPFRRVVNNGCEIETQDVDLIRQIRENEFARGSEVIDWHLFKPGRTILIDNMGRKFGCTRNVYGQWIELTEIVG